MWGHHPPLRYQKGGPDRVLSHTALLGHLFEHHVHLGLVGLATQLQSLCVDRDWVGCGWLWLLGGAAVLELQEATLLVSGNHTRKSALRFSFHRLSFPVLSP